MFKRTIIISFILFLIIATFQISSVKAEVKSFQANGFYIMNDAETVDTAQQVALKEAERTIVEQAGVYIESYTKVKNNHIVSDEILSLASSIIKITHKTFENKVDEQGNIQVIARITAEIDTARIDEKLKNGDYSNILQKQDKLNESLERQNQEISELKKKLNEANDNYEKNNRQNTNDAKINNKKDKYEEKMYVSSNRKVNTADIYDSNGLELFRMGRYNDAISQFNLAISNNKDFTVAYLHRGDTYLAMATRDNNRKLMDLATSDYSMTIKLAPDAPFGYLGRAFSYLSRRGDNENYSDNYNKAFSDLNKALQIDSNNATAHEYMGQYYYLIGNDQLAIKYLNNAIRINPGDKFAYFYRGLAYKGLGDIDNYEKDVKKAKELGVIINENQL